MASTYSTKLRLELIATGEQSSTWGITTNGTIGTMLEQAIAGVGAVVFAADADHTLTTANGSVDEARNAVLTCTSGVSLTATRNLVIPAGVGLTKLYAVYNTTTGGQSIVAVPSGGSGVTIPNGYVAQVWCDGTNAYQMGAQYNPTTGQIYNAAASVWDAGDMKWTSRAAAPSGWLACGGQAVSRTTYAGLFAAIGTTYGVGDGSTTFNLPDGRGRALFGLDNMGGSAASRLTAGGSGITGTTLGASGGNELLQSHTHYVSDPGHSHGVSEPGHSHGVNDPGHHHDNGVAFSFITAAAGGVGTAASGFAGFQTSTVGTGISNQAAFAGVSVNSTFTGVSAQNTGGGGSQNVPPALVQLLLIKT